MWFPGNLNYPLKTGQVLCPIAAHSVVIKGWAKVPDSAFLAFHRREISASHPFSDHNLAIDLVGPAGAGQVLRAAIEVAP